MLDYDARNDPDGLTISWLNNAGVGTVGHLTPGLDIRGAGGIVVTAPSIHPNGKPYERLTDRLSTVPEDVVAMIHARQSQDAAKGDRAGEGGATLAGADVLAVL